MSIERVDKHIIDIYLVLTSLIVTTSLASSPDASPGFLDAVLQVNIYIIVLCAFQ